MAGSLDLFDGVDLTASSEYSSRNGRKVQYLQIHHATLLSLAVLIAMMDPGGRQVSANGALGNDGHLVEVVPLSQRAFTSASRFDEVCLTVETCNTSLHPTWGISAASRERLARLAVAMFQAGLLGAISRQFIIGHYEVPGTYATSCPGPDMQLDWIVQRAHQIQAGGFAPQPKEITMAFERVVSPADGYVYFKDELGCERVVNYVDSSMSNGEIIEGLNLLFGAQQGGIAKGSPAHRLHDVGMAIASRRVAAYRKSLVADVAAAVTPGVVSGVVTALRPLLEAITPTVDIGALTAAVREQVDTSVDEALAGIQLPPVTVDVPAIAAAVQDEEDRRDRERLGA